MPAQTPYRAETSGWGASFTLSLLLHGLLLGGLAAWAWYLNRNLFTMGDPNAKLGGAVGVNVVETIPIPQPPAPERKVARDTENEVPDKPEPKKVERRDDDGIALLKKKKKTPEKKIDLAKLADKRLLPEEKLPNRLSSNMGSKARSEMYRVQGMGSVGVGDNSPFGAGLGWYATLLQKKLGEKWSAEEVPRLSTYGRTVVNFTIFRNGNVGNGKVIQSSGNPAADRAALRAVEAINPFVALPPQFPRDAAFVEFYFDLKQ
jgi:TonB family protein